MGPVGLANNHRSEYTEEGLEEILRRLFGVGFTGVGTGCKGEADRAFFFTRRERQRVALIEFVGRLPDFY